MKDIFKHFIEDRENGLLLYDPPTGSGKTYNAFEFIADIDWDSNKDREKVYFLAPQHNLIDEDKLKEAFKKRGKLEQFNKHFFHVYNDFDALLNVYNNKKLFKNIEDAIVKNDVKPQIFYKISSLLDKYIFDFNKHLKAELYDEQYFEGKREEINNLAREYKQYIKQSYLPDVPQSKLINIIWSNDNFSWIKDLFPIVNIYKSRIICMSVHKFLYGANTVIESSFSFYNSKHINNSIIFIDEIDKFTDISLSYITDFVKKLGKLDYPRLVYIINKGLSTKKFSSKYYTNDAKKLLNELKKEFRTLSNNYNLNANSYLRDDIKEENLIKKSFIFNDLNWSVLNRGISKGRYLMFSNNKKQDLNEIYYSSRFDKQKNYLLLLGKLEYSISHFLNSVERIASLQMEYDTQKKQNTERTWTNYIDSILDDIIEEGSSKNYLRALILNGISIFRKKRLSNNTKMPDRSFYNTGFKYWQFYKDSSALYNYKTLLTDMYTSPESLIYKMATKANVIGLSATANLQSAFTNVDINYLQKILMGDMYQIRKEDSQRQDKYLNTLTKYSNKLNIHVKDVTCKVNEYDMEAKVLIDKISDNKSKTKNWGSFNKEFMRIESNYEKERLIKILKNLMDFINDASHYASICFTTRSIKSIDGNREYECIKCFVDILLEVRKNHKNIDKENFLFFINSKNYEQSMKKAKELLFSGKKIYILASYKTIGTGVNLDYKFNKKYEHPINIFDRGDNKKKDIDWVYFEMPTNIIPNMLDNENDYTEIDLLKNLYYVEKLYYMSEINYLDKRKCLNICFNKFVNPNEKRNWVNAVSNSISKNNAGLYYIKQACGRLNRAGNKNVSPKIFLDSNILKKLDFSLLNHEKETIEMQEIIKFCLNSTKMSNNWDDIKEVNSINAALIQDKASRMDIRYYVYHNRSNMTEELYADYKNIGMFLLQHPTVDNPCEFDTYYMKSPSKVNSFSYTVDNKYEDDGEKYCSDISFHVDGLCSKFSSEAVNLSIFRKMSWLKEYFQRYKIPTEFQLNNYILTPAASNDIYKGRLGEFIGKSYFEHFLNINLDELALQEFERFDFVVNKNIYIDFKFWKDRQNTFGEQEIKKAFQKLQFCDGRLGLVINTNIAKSNKNWVINRNEKENMLIYEIPNLYKLDKANRQYIVDLEISRQIEEIINNI